MTIWKSFPDTTGLDPVAECDANIAAVGFGVSSGSWPATKASRPRS